MTLLPACDGTLTFPGGVPTCSGTWVAVENSAEILAVKIGELSTVLNDFFGFDADLFSLVVGLNLVTWAIGHGVGRMMQAWRKTM